MGFLRRLKGAPPASPSNQPPPPPRHTGPITDWSLAAMNNRTYSAGTADATTGNTVSVVGESAYQGTLERIGGGRTIDGVREPDHQAVLLPEPDNKYDPNAVRVVVLPEGVIGYSVRPSTGLPLSGCSRRVGRPSPADGIAAATAASSACASIW